MLGDAVAVEVKAKESVSTHDLRSLRAIADEKAIRRCFSISLEARERDVDGIRVMPYAAFLEELWA